MTTSELIVRSLDLAGNRAHEREDEFVEVVKYAEAIQARYGELKRTHDFTTAAIMTREEFVNQILHTLPTVPKVLYSHLVKRVFDEYGIQIMAEWEQRVLNGEHDIPLPAPYEHND